MPAPEIPGKRTLWRNPRLGEVAIPLRPDGRLRLRQVERVDDLPTLPAIVRSVLAWRKRRKTGRGVPEPLAVNATGEWS